MKRLLAYAAIVLLLVSCTALPAFAEQDPRQVLMGAMESELERSMQRLNMPGFESPYFISYMLRDREAISINAGYGALLASSGSHRRIAYVEVRVGDYKFDNSGRGGFEFPMGPEMEYESYLDYIDAPADDDPMALRRMLWRATDLRYKGALSSYQQKKARQVFEVDPEVEIDDFSRQEPHEHIDKPMDFDIDSEAWEESLRKESAYLASIPGIIDFGISFRAGHYTKIYVNSEGARIATEEMLMGFSADATMRADDGMLLVNTVSIYGRSIDAFPDKQALHAELERMVADLQALKEAPVIDPYTGPAILGPEVAGVFFHEAVGHRLEGERQRNEDEGQTFANKVGDQVIPEFLSVIDDPTLLELYGHELNGYYTYDDEGVPSQRVVLIEDGILRNYLLSRAPIEGFNKSNGHGRSARYEDPMARMGNTIVQSTRTMSDDELKAKLIELAREQGKPYGLIIKGSVGGHTSTSSYNFQAFSHRPLLIYKVDAETGEETLVRGAEIVGTPLVSINKIVATGSKYEVFNGYCGAESGYVPVSAVAPAILITEVELQKIGDKPQRSPILPPPDRE